jgi:acyl carrier protein
MAGAGVARPPVPESGADDGDALARVVRVLRDCHGIPASQAIDGDTRLVRGGLGLDSVAVLEFVMALEEAFGLAIADEEMAAENFASVGAVAALVRRKRLGRTRADAGD